MNNAPVLHGNSKQVFVTVQSAMANEANRKLHFVKKDELRGEHYRIRSAILLTKSEKEKVMEAITQTIACRKVTIETSKWTKAWLTTTKGTVIRLYPLV